MQNKIQFPKCTAAYHNLVSCHCCNKLAPSTQQVCKRCKTILHLRTPNSIQRTMALLITAMLFYIPANVFPIMNTMLLGDVQASTIIGGVLLFVEHESYFIAAVIFSASVVIPIGKMMLILWLCYSTSRPSNLSGLELTKLYRVTEFIGKWSMVDIFVVAVLVALVQVAGIMAIQPGTAAQAFAIVVILTMLAAHQFDVRLIWDKQLQQ